MSARDRYKHCGLCTDTVRCSWVVGALEASIRAVNEILRSSCPTKDAVEFENTYGLPEGWTKDMLLTQRTLGAGCAFGEDPPTQTA